MSVRDRLTKALKYDERIWRAFQVLKPIHRDGLLDALQAALVADNENATLLDDMKERIEQWFRRAVTQVRIEGESASIKFELFGDSRGYTPNDEPLYEVAVEEKLIADHLSGTVPS